MRISAVRVKDYKRIKEVSIAVGANRTLMVIGGENAQGKSSLLDALSVAFGGTRLAPPEPVRRGAKRSEIEVETVDPTMRIRRTFTAKGGGTLEIIDVDGVVRKPQERLDALVGKRFLDPWAFVTRPAAEQRAMLLSVIPEADTIADLEAQRKAAYDNRTAVNRDLKRAEAQLAGIAPARPVPSVPSADAVKAQVADARARLATAQAIGKRYRDAQQTEERWRSAVERLTAELEEAKRQLGGAQRAVAAVAAERGADLGEQDAQRELDALVDQVTASSARAAEVAAIRAANDRRALAEKEVAELGARADALSSDVEMAESTKAAILASARLPVDGLGFDDTGVTLDGLPLEQASGAQKLRVALGIAAAAGPALRDVWIRDGALLDDTSMAIIEEFARDRGLCVWIERVGDDDPGALVIEDGMVAT